MLFEALVIAIMLYQSLLLWSIANITDRIDDKIPDDE